MQLFRLLHWSGNSDEVQAFETQIRALAGGTGPMANADYNAGTRSQPLGDAKAGFSADLDALAAYVRSLDSFAPSPLRMAGDVLSTQAVAGHGVFAARCASCHGTAAFTRSADGILRNVGTLKASSGTRLGAPLTGIDIPTLPALSAVELASVGAFVRQIGGTEPAVPVVANGRYVRFEALSEVNGNLWASMGEFDLLNTAGQTQLRLGWRITASSSEETRSENGAAANVLDGRAAALLAAAPVFRPAHAHSAAGVVQPPLAPPPVALQLHDGRRRPLAELLRGRVIALQLMFTGCSATCPIQGALFADAQRQLMARPQAVAGAQLVSLSIDPLADDPRALSAWRQRFEAGPLWTAASPAMRDLDPWLDFLQGRRVGVDRHTTQVYLFNRRGELVLHSVDFPPAAEIVRWLHGLAAMG